MLINENDLCDQWLPIIQFFFTNYVLDFVVL